MSSDRVNAVSPATTTRLSGINGVDGYRPSASVLERRQIEAQAGVKRLEQSARMLGFGATGGSGDDMIPRPGTPPPPASTVTPPPAQQPPPAGLETGADGFPPGSIKTPGGYVIVVEGKDAAWEVYGPEQKPGDTPLTKVWGDPHVNEKDGTRWDFTKDSNFMLPDGTVIRADTTSEEGHSLTQGLTIVSGNDRIDVTGVNTGSPHIGAKSADGNAWLNGNLPTLEKGATFILRSDGNNVDWFRATNGKLEGVVTGSKENFDGKHSYDQVIGNGGPAVDVKAATARYGDMGAGGLGFLAAFDVNTFVAQVGSALASLVEQEDLKDRFSASMSANRNVRSR
jgi:hypothetical protein